MRYNAGRVNVGTPYKNPPLVEAIAEFRFPPGTELDVVVPGLVYQELRREFPKSRAAVGIESAVKAGPAGIEQRLTQTPRLQLRKDDERIVVQVSPAWLAVNHVAPYRSWELEYLPAIMRALEVYALAAGVTGVLSATLRYVNRITLDGEGPHELKKFFTVYPELEGGNEQLGHFRLALQFPPANQGRLQVEMAPFSLPSEWGVQFELTYAYADPAPLPVASASAWLERAHGTIEDFFERAIKEPLRGRFGRDQVGGQ